MEKHLFMDIFRKKTILIKICFEKIRVRLRVRLQGPCTRLQKSVHVAALLVTIADNHYNQSRSTRCDVTVT